LHEGRVIVDETPESLLARTRAADLEAAFLNLLEATGVPA
jgi:ABC-type Na+ transport system ATPase subunit NatA